ncbi:hypothetical protein GCM10009717_25830 [Agromyces allii]|uniref:Uncharacterized protein n=1 Tax=Agromyces allii TaxID=393607 RepID=A0ABN2QU94_9MICO
MGTHSHHPTHIPQRSGKPSGKPKHRYEGPFTHGFRVMTKGITQVIGASAALVASCAGLALALPPILPYLF